MNENVYAAPETSPEDIIEKSAEQLASRWARLGASVLDGLIMSLITLPIMYFTGGLDGIFDPEYKPSLLYQMAMAVIGIIVFVALNLKFLMSNGQTIGKRILNIQIVDLNGNLPTLKKNLLKRYATYFLPAQIPFAGSVFSLANVLFIFRKDCRCIHDLAGGTKVIKYRGARHSS
ncbi:RDD family protein [Akkermansiaceae bacterium]|nr:RDD family protein [Akkermansiaceae bacterium]